MDTSSRLANNARRIGIFEDEDTYAQMRSHELHPVIMQRQAFILREMRLYVANCARYTEAYISQLIIVMLEQMRYMNKYKCVSKINKFWI